MALRAYYEQNSKHDVLDRIEVYDSDFSGTAFQLTGDKTGFTFKHDIVTSETNQALLNPHANRIQVGKLDFKPFIDSSQGFTLLEDIRDATGGQFAIKWLRDGSLWWQGTVTTRIFSYPEKANNFVGKIRATDFDVLKGNDYPLSDNRQTLITSLADCFSQTGFSHSIVTRTSWTEENLDSSITGDYDFLNQIYHETKALRDFANTGDETDQQITYYEALEHLAEPALFIRQHAGNIYIEQLTELADPTNVVEATYDSTGTQQSISSNNDIRQTGYTSVDNGTPVVKNSSQNDSYPAVKRAIVKFDHRSRALSQIFPSYIEITSSDGSKAFDQAFSSDGNQGIAITADVDADLPSGESNGRIRWELQAGSYWYDTDNVEWVSSQVINITELTDSATQSNPNTNRWYGTINSRSLAVTVPNDADGLITVTIYAPQTDSSTGTGRIRNANLEIVNELDVVANSTSIDYELTDTQRNETEVFKLDDTWLGDGPNRYSASALRYGTGDTETTSGTWQRRGTTTGYRNYHENLLKEVLDLQRNNTRKLKAEIWGDYDPSKVLNYDGDYLFYAGGRYEGAYGRWKVTLMRLNIVEDSNDTFDDIPKFTDETGSGTGTTSTGGTSGGLDQSTADARYFKQSSNLSEGDPTTLQANIGLKNASADLDFNSIDIAGNPFVNASRNVTAGTGTFSGLLTAQSGIGVGVGNNIVLAGADVGSVNDSIYLPYDADNSLGPGILYEDSGGTSRYAMRISNDVVRISNRAPDGIVEIYANSSTAGGGGETLSATFKDTGVDISGLLTAQGGITVSSGNLVVSNGVSQAQDHEDVSDARMKSNFESVDPLLFADAVNDKLYSFDKEGLGKRQIGLIAQDMESVHSDAVGWMDDKKYGKIRTLSGYTVASIALSGVGVLHKKIERLEQRIKELENG